MSRHGGTFETTGVSVLLGANKVPAFAREPKLVEPALIHQVHLVGSNPLQREIVDMTGSRWIILDVDGEASLPLNGALYRCIDESGSDQVLGIRNVCQF